LSAAFFHFFCSAAHKLHHVSIYAFGVAAINKIIAHSGVDGKRSPCSLSMQRGWLKVATYYLTSLD
jgi:hypothetical protein